MANPYNPYAPAATSGAAFTPNNGNNRSAYTGTIGDPSADAGGNQIGSSFAPVQSQLANHAGAPVTAGAPTQNTGYPSMTPAQAQTVASKAPGTYDAQGNYTPPIENTSPDQAWGYVNNEATALGGNPYLNYGDPARAANASLQLQAAGAAARQAPQLNTTGVNMFATGTGNSLQQAQGSDLYAAAGGLNLSGTATGAGYQGQLGSAQQLQSAASGPGVVGQLGIAGQLQGLATTPAGPSVAQQQLSMGADQSLQQQLAIAAGARGGNAGLALQNAGQNQGQVMGQLNQQQGLLRAQEDMANRQFSASTLGAAANTYGNAGNLQGSLLGAANQGYGAAAGTQQAGYGGAANVFQGIAGNQVGQANTQAGLAGTYAGLSQAQLQGQLQQQSLNDQTMLQSQQMGYNLLDAQRASELQAQQANANTATQNQAIQTNYNQALNLQANDWTHQLVGAGIGAAGGALGFLAGGPAGAAVGAGVGYGAGSKLSDIRAKTDVVPASGQVADAFRPLSSSSYFYKDPNQPGAVPGQQFGPMAQQLEQTPAGSTAVTQMPDGSKGIDTGRLSLLNASATADLRRELDAIKGQGRAIRDTSVDYPKLARLDSENADDQATLSGIDDAQRKALLALRTPTDYPAPSGYGAY